MKTKMPEPVAWSVLNKRTGKHWYTNESRYTSQGYANHYSHNDSNGPSQIVEPLITTDQAEAYADARVQEALEAAASVCDVYAEDHCIGFKRGEPSCADAVRALITK